MSSWEPVTFSGRTLLHEVTNFTQWHVITLCKQRKCKPRKICLCEKYFQLTYGAKYNEIYVQYQFSTNPNVLEINKYKLANEPRLFWYEWKLRFSKVTSRNQEHPAFGNKCTLKVIAWIYSCPLSYDHEFCLILSFRSTCQFSRTSKLYPWYGIRFCTCYSSATFPKASIGPQSLMKRKILKF
jgi:hypothetical protein